MNRLFTLLSSTMDGLIMCQDKMFFEHGYVQHLKRRADSEYGERFARRFLYARFEEEAASVVA